MAFEIGQRHVLDAEPLVSNIVDMILHRECYSRRERSTTSSVLSFTTLHRDGTISERYAAKGML
jgi:hypothetical protein